MKYQETCKECGYQRTVYTYPINVGRVKTLKNLVDLYEKTGKPVALDDATSSKTQYTAFCHLQYFRLAQMVGHGKGPWIPTQKGIDFIYGKTTIPTPVKVMTGSNEPLQITHPAWKGEEGRVKLVSIHDIDETSYKQKEEFQEEKSNTLF